jgi:hypothetical protein
MGPVQRLLDEVSAAAARIYREAVDPLEARFAFEKRPSSGEVSGAPMVLFLGNHSSGKSTFINHLLGAPVQKTGLAPTDDAFTILAWGRADEEREGQAVAGNPELPFAGLASYGPGFLSHLRLKLRPLEFLRDVRLIDSPGMIDAPREGGGRGYDYGAVVRWFAERADLVLVFFDPEKPGTTGETLDVFLRSLQGFDHKLAVVMNRVDQFRGLQDFARAYGALCWNLAKVIPRKDLPHVYTTFVPVPDAPPPTLPAGDFERSREDLIHEIRRAPARRADNVLTQLRDHAERLRLHVRVSDRAARERRRVRNRSWALLGLAALSSVLAGAVTLAAETKIWIPLGFFGLAALIIYGGAFVVRRLLKSEEGRILDSLTPLFERAHAKELVTRDRADDLRARWQGVLPKTRAILETLGLASIPRVPSDMAQRLDQAIEREIPDLRARLHRDLAAEAARVP